jgi:hypothetical protein
MSFSAKRPSKHEVFGNPCSSAVTKTDPTVAYLTDLMIPIMYLGYATSLLLVITSCTALYVIKKVSSA